MNQTDTKKICIDIINKIDFEKVVDHPNILIAAQLWDEERYQAAKVCYKFMRAIDDLIDDHKTIHSTISDELKDVFEYKVKIWIETIIQSDNSEYKDIVDVIMKMKIPTWPLEAFSKSMIYDIHHDGFHTLDEFIDYAQGASVAPAAIFVHLCGLTREGDNYVAPAFDVREVATP